MSRALLLTTSSPSFAQSIVYDAKENREEKNDRANLFFRSFLLRHVRRPGLSDSFPGYMQYYCGNDPYLCPLKIKSRQYFHYFL